MTGRVVLAAGLFLGVLGSMSAHPPTAGEPAQPPRQNSVSSVKFCGPEKSLRLVLRASDNSSFPILEAQAKGIRMGARLRIQEKVQGAWLTHAEETASRGGALRIEEPHAQPGRWRAKVKDGSIACSYKLRVP